MSYTEKRYHLVVIEWNCQDGWRMSNKAWCHASWCPNAMSLRLSLKKKPSYSCLHLHWDVRCFFFFNGDPVSILLMSRQRRMDQVLFPLFRWVEKHLRTHNSLKDIKCATHFYTQRADCMRWFSGTVLFSVFLSVELSHRRGIIVTPGDIFWSFCNTILQHPSWIHVHFRLRYILL